MPFRQIGSLRIYQFQSLTLPDLIHGVFTRRGGVSPAPWDSLNVGGLVGDERERVIENRHRCFAALGREAESLFDVWQVHSAEVVVARAPRHAESLRQADAIVTDRPEVTLFMRFADCVPVLLFDRRRSVVGLAHAGWLGTVRKTTAATVRTMVQAYGTDPGDLVGAIGPSVGPDHYPIGPEVVAQVREAFGSQADRHLRRVDGREHLDLWSANRALLVEQGVGTIEESGICTACHVDDWFSHRGEAGRTGRFGALIALNSG